MGGSDTSAGGGGTAANELCIVRPALNVTQRCANYHYDPGTKPGILERLKNKAVSSCRCSGSCVKSAITSRLPILSWLPSYSLKNSLLGDLIAGITVAIMHIPQGMAYALLGGLPPITGIYMAFFPVLVYIIFGTSRHCSMGTFAVVCLMTGKVVNELATDDDQAADNLKNNLTSNSTLIYTPNQVAAIVTLMVGLWEFIFGVLQIGALSVFLSDMLVSGFTTGAAVHVLTSQVKYLFGIQVERHNGPLKIIYTYRDIISQLLESNQAAMVVSGLTIGVLVINNEVLKPWARKKTKIPIPIELLAVSIGTAASYFGKLHDNYNIRIVGDIPTGLPEPTAPPFELLPRVVVDTFVITIVAYTVSFSMAKIFAKKKNYSVDATQELYSQGLSNVFGSFFGCGPIAASLSRSLIQEAVGGVTQITSLISCVLLLFVLLFVGPWFESLPNAVDVPTVCIFQFIGPLHFANSEYFRLKLFSVSGLNPSIIAANKTLHERSCSEPDITGQSNGEINVTVPQECSGDTITEKQTNGVAKLIKSKIHTIKAKQVALTMPSKFSQDIQWLIIEMSGVSYIDSTGGKVLTQLHKEYKEAGIILCLSAVPENVLESLEQCGALKTLSADRVFHSTHDAVTILTQDNFVASDCTRL